MKKQTTLTFVLGTHSLRQGRVAGRGLDALGNVGIHLGRTVVLAHFLFRETTPKPLYSITKRAPNVKVYASKRFRTALYPAHGSPHAVSARGGKWNALTSAVLGYMSVPSCAGGIFNRNGQQSYGSATAGNLW